MISQTKCIITTVLCMHSIFIPNIALTQSLLNTTELETKIKQINYNESDGSCTTPLIRVTSNHTTVEVFCKENPTETCPTSQVLFPKSTAARVICDPNYFLDHINNESSHICKNGEWSPKIVECRKKCDQLDPKGDLTNCISSGIEHNNDKNSVRLAGTNVYPAIANEDTSNSSDRSNENRNHLHVPECGIAYSSSKSIVRPYIEGGTEESNAESPWHVAIYFNSNKELICSGTIITEYLVVSAAHCFDMNHYCNNTSCKHHTEYCNGTKCVDNFEVIVAKHRRNYTEKDPDQKSMKIKEIRFSNKGYFGIKNHYAADIALLILRDAIPRSPKVNPACLQWENFKKEEYSTEGKSGKVAGWGLTGNETYSIYLMSVSLTYNSHKECLEMLPDDQKNSISLDKFCAGPINGTDSKAKRGDSGGGIFFKYNSTYYLRGVVSTEINSSLPNTFTDLADHMDWILSVRNEIKSSTRRISIPKDGDTDTQPRIDQSLNNLESKLEKLEIQLNNKLDSFEKKLETLLNNKLDSLEKKFQQEVIAIPEKARKEYLSSAKCEKLNPQNVNLHCFRYGITISNCDENSVLLAGTIVHPKCKLSYKYEMPPNYSEIRCNEDGKWDNQLYPCVPGCGKPYIPTEVNVIGIEEEFIGGSPWHVAIYNANKKLICGGTIITEYLIVSAATCTMNCNDPECFKQFEVVVGKYHGEYRIKDSDQKSVEIKDIRYSDKGLPSLENHFEGDIVLLILQDPISLSLEVMPACLNEVDLKNRKYPEDNKLGKLVAWCKTNETGEILMRFTSPYIGHQQCVDTHKDIKPFLTSDKFCAEITDTTDTGYTFSTCKYGSGMLFEDNGLFYLRGVLSAANGNSLIVTDLTDYVDWILSVHNTVEPKKILKKSNQSKQAR